MRRSGHNHRSESTNVVRPTMLPGCPFLAQIAHRCFVARQKDSESRHFARGSCKPLLSGFFGGRSIMTRRFKGLSFSSATLVGMILARRAQNASGSLTHLCRDRRFINKGETPHIKTGLLGYDSARAAVTSGRSCSAARSFFEGNVVTIVECPDRAYCGLHPLLGPQSVAARKSSLRSRARFRTDLTRC